MSKEIGASQVACKRVSCLVRYVRARANRHTNGGPQVDGGGEPDRAPQV